MPNAKKFREYKPRHMMGPFAPKVGNKANETAIIRPQSGPQERFLSSSADIVIYGGQAGSGKLLALDTIIPTPDSWCLNGDLQAGQMVLDEQGKPTRILAAHDVETPERAYEMTFDSGQTVKAGAEHLWFTVADGVGAVRTTEAIAASLGRGHAIPMAPPHPGYFHHIAKAEPITPVPMRCITVDNPTGLYLCSRSMIPTHNTYALLLEPVRHVGDSRFRCVIFRRTYAQVRKQGGLWDTSYEIYPLLGASPNVSDLKWTFPKGSTITFAHMQHEHDRYQWDGAQITLIAYDQLESFDWSQFSYMFSRNRSGSHVRPYIRGTCLSGDTVIPCADGRLIRLEACTSMDSVLSAQVDTASIFAEPPSNFFSRDVEDGLRVITTAGEIIASKDHTLFRWSPTGLNEVACDQLAPGDFIAAARRLPHGTSDMDPEEAYLVGYSAGDGGVTGRKATQRLLWTEQDSEHAQTVASIARSVLPATVGVHSRSTSKAFSVYTTRPSVAGACFIRNYRGALGPSHLRSIPAQCTAGNETAVRALLQGIFDAEGHVGADRIAIAMTSRVAIHQISALLRRWGIMARFDLREPVPPRKSVYRLTLHGAHAARFAREIGFRMRRKREAALALADRIEQSTWQRCSDADLVPVHRESIAHLRRFLGKSWWNRNKCLRRDTVDRVLARAASAGDSVVPLATWAAHAWEKVKYIRPAGPIRVYDITMPTAHTYFAGCALSHNCNPNPDSFLRWFIGWWIDDATGLAIPERSGIVRYFVLRGHDPIFADTAEELIDELGPDSKPKSLTFIPASIDDNKILLERNPDYLASLEALTHVDRQRLRHGNWNVRESAGSFFQRDWFPKERIDPVCAQVVRYWDRAVTPMKEGKPVSGASWTAGVKMGRTEQSTYIVLDVIRFQGSALEVERTIAQTAEADGHEIEQVIEQDPGQAGKAEAQHQARNLAGYNVSINLVRESKANRAKPFSAQAQAGNVSIRAAIWNEPFLRELENFDGTPNSMADQVDACSGAFHSLTTGVKIGIW